MKKSWNTSTYHENYFSFNDSIFELFIMSLTAAEVESVLSVLKNRFLQNISRHQNADWDQIEKKLNENPEKIKAIHWMEETGGEPDVVVYNYEEYFIVDCSKESPSGRRSLCYDDAALRSRKENAPIDSALRLAEENSLQILDEKMYFYLQSLGDFDTKTSSWLHTPTEIREKGGAIFGDFRFGRIFIYHNGAESYYSSRGFRTILRV